MGFSQEFLHDLHQYLSKNGITEAQGIEILASNYREIRQAVKQQLQEKDLV